jgi:hypothetical protein
VSSRSEATTPTSSKHHSLFQICSCCQIDLAGDDERLAAPVRAKPAAIGRSEVPVKPRGMIASDDITIGPAQITVVITEIDCEHAFGDAETEIPVRITPIRNTVWEKSTACSAGRILGAVEGVGRSQEPIAGLR